MTFFLADLAILAAFAGASAAAVALQVRNRREEAVVTVKGARARKLARRR
ncbi:hypothetical protein [Afifella marina]|uniref:Uncharacterized protein n=1 Tax=Afifella marina DSM 2698 TaxID=1120955 RepID=A0A1G5MUN7_AFIMA|nr:hypothetical protein [Afifella marina]SCZ28895.1 hypothetical protein SAMN03080610_01058 [Afifella marina DSM 2698]